jgi:hypothetical protein
VKIIRILGNASSPGSASSSLAKDNVLSFELAQQRLALIQLIEAARATVSTQSELVGLRQEEGEEIGCARTRQT